MVGPMTLVPDPARVAALAAALPRAAFSAPSCGHAATRGTVTRVDPAAGAAAGAAIICAECFGAVAAADAAGRLEEAPRLPAGHECFACGAPSGSRVAVRVDADVGMPICDGCRAGSRAAEAAAAAGHRARAVCPDEIIRGLLFVGPKEAACVRAPRCRVRVFASWTQSRAGTTGRCSRSGASLACSCAATRCPRSTPASRL